MEARHTPPLLIVISGPSGVGKDTVVQALRERGLAFHFVVTTTSRERRPHEVEGEDYFFIDEAEFLRMIDEGELLEHALVYGQHKGVPKRQVRDALDSGLDVVMRVDVQGARTIRELAPEAVLIFLSATEEELLRRLRERRTESDEALARRLETAKQEFSQLEAFDYRVENSDSQVEAAVDTILAIIDAEHHRTVPRTVVL